MSQPLSPAARAAAVPARGDYWSFLRSWSRAPGDRKSVV